jgi:ferredoxin
VSPQPLDSVKGFAVTFRQLFKKPITQQYPEYKRPVYPRFRGRHRLHRHENGLEKCVGCSLCAAACPADCIRVVAEENFAVARPVNLDARIALPELRRRHVARPRAARRVGMGGRVRRCDELRTTRSRAGVSRHLRTLVPRTRLDRPQAVRVLP